MMSRWMLINVLALAACTDAKQIVLSINTTASVPCDIDHIRVRAHGTHTTTLDHDVTNGRFPIKITLSDETSLDSFQIDVIGLKGTEEVLSTTGQVSFSGKPVTAIMLDRSCTAESPCQLESPPPESTPFQCVRRYILDPKAGDTFLDACTVNTGTKGTIPMGPSELFQPLPPALVALITQSDFRFYGKPISQILVHVNGYLEINKSQPEPENTLTPGPLDGALAHTGGGPPSDAVMAFWDDLSRSANGVCYQLSGDAGTQTLLLTWKQICAGKDCKTNGLSFTIKLDERSQNISFAYSLSATALDNERGFAATVGIVKDADGCPLDQCDASTNLCHGSSKPCGYTQAFSNAVQPSLQSFTFEPVVEN